MAIVGLSCPSIFQMPTGPPIASDVSADMPCGHACMFILISIAIIAGSSMSTWTVLLSSFTGLTHAARGCLQALQQPCLQCLWLLALQWFTLLSLGMACFV